ncbi:AMP-dependent synthetase/ligase [Caballeronia sp. 15715]|uniref:AMP-dependent synthetase/ligase n=1 Tax=Caballeronia sp. 15715 TaxID=3391030 RepID=UPI0039E450A4
MTDSSLPADALIATLPQLWRNACLRDPQRTALRFKRRGVWAGTTWAQFYEDTRAIALALSEVGIQRGEVISLLSENRPEWMSVDLGAQAMGMISHGIYPTDSGLRLANVLCEAGSCAVIVENVEQLAKILAIRSSCPKLAHIVIIETRGLGGFKDPHVLLFADLLSRGRALSETKKTEFEANITEGHEHQVAVLAQTAASTGAAKLATIAQRNLMHIANNLDSWLKVRSWESSLSVTSLANMAERVLTVVAPLVTPLMIHFPESPATVLNDLREVRPKIVFAPPRFWENLHTDTETLVNAAFPIAQWAYRHSMRCKAVGIFERLMMRNVRRSLGLQNIRMAISGCASVSPALTRWYRALGVPMFEGYGLAETVGFASLTVASDGISSGAAIEPPQGLEIKLAVDGEILLRGAAVHMGYWRDGTVTVNPGSEGWLQSGDFGTTSVGGEIHLGGRMSDRFDNSAGITISPNVFERELRLCPYVFDALLIGNGRPYCTVLVAVDHEMVGQYAQENHISYTDHASLISRKEVIALIGMQIDIVNTKLLLDVCIRGFRIIGEPLFGDSEELTPALRLRRYLTERKYSVLLEEMYAV